MSTADAPHGKTMLERMGHFLVIFAYLWLLLCVYTLHNTLVLPDWGLAAHLGAATLKALVLAKFVLIGEHLKLGSRAERLPLVWVVLIKAALFAVLLIGFNILEELIVEAIRPQGGGVDDNALPMDDLSSITSLAVMAFIALIPFFAISELTRVLGEERMRILFFGKPPA
ncbi:hypothetical protein [Parvibaculum sp.]|jgi:hypothetical protein|uniref:hypothetical protein n=1 Tax=Parvibaculum sp. TaxID=2024848 RepID=UPI001B04EE7D|nr:hypothetical protein [Parvibaculum sp.]MBO6633999.1 hypothetical protein [Parvibaculum sp.]MBO6680055.1 hypothetical protein [Parvibaculum sp.]MBO6683616.1 hypothetical protein [Parvibaculum sp.]MBO6904407.1 hypothetical protein [Parvibaculum sp.]